MPRSEYHNLRKTADREQWVSTICSRLGIEPDFNKAVDFALAVTVSGLAVPNTACTRTAGITPPNDVTHPEASTVSGDNLSEARRL